MLRGPCPGGWVRSWRFRYSRSAGVTDADLVFLSADMDRTMIHGWLLPLAPLSACEPERRSNRQLVVKEPAASSSLEPVVTVSAERARVILVLLTFRFAGAAIRLSTLVGPRPLNSRHSPAGVA